LSFLPNLKAYKEARDIFITFGEDIGSVLKVASEGRDDEAMILSKAANIVRSKMKEMNCVFNGNFQTNCQKNSVPETLLHLVSMILRGSNIKTNLEDASVSQPALTISQLLQFNCTFRRYDKQ